MAGDGGRGREPSQAGLAVPHLRGADRGPPPQVVYYVFAIVGITLFRGVIVAPPGNGR